MIKLSDVSIRFTRLIGRRDPIAPLATLILLSYTKLLSVTITALSFAVLEYPDGSRETVWLPDGNVKYFQGKHIALVTVALLIILVGVEFPILFFSFFGSGLFMLLSRRFSNGQETQSSIPLSQFTMFHSIANIVIGLVCYCW